MNISIVVPVSPVETLPTMPPKVLVQLTDSMQSAWYVPMDHAVLLSIAGLFAGIVFGLIIAGFWFSPKKKVA